MTTGFDRQRTLSLAARVMLFVAAAVALCLFVLGTVVELSIRRHFAEQDTEELQVVVEAVRRVLSQHPEDISQLRVALDQAVSGHHGVYFQVTDETGAVLYALPGPNLMPLTQGQPPVSQISITDLIEWHGNAGFFRGAVAETGPETPMLRITVAADMTFHMLFLHRFQRTLWAIMVAAGLVTLLAAWLGVRQGHLPLMTLGRAIRDIQSDRLQTRLDPQTVPVELQELVNSFNQMIGQLEEGFNRLSHFSSDIAHELRTPLTNLITQTQVALGAKRTSEEYRDILYSNLEEQERLAKMVSDMLWLAKTDRGLIKPAFSSMASKEEVLALFEFFEAWADEKEVKLKLVGSDPTVLGDRAMLRRALSNLLSNAIRHTPSGGTVSVYLKYATKETAVIEIQNPGQEIPPEHLPRIFDRFYCSDPSRQRQDKGTGLGLAIARSIIELHDGNIAVRSDGALTVFSISLPILQSPQIIQS